MFTIAAVLMGISVIALVWLHIREEKRRAIRYAELFKSKKEQEEADRKLQETAENIVKAKEEAEANITLDDLAQGIKDELSEPKEELSEVDEAMQAIKEARNGNTHLPSTETELELDK